MRRQAKHLRILLAAVALATPGVELSPVIGREEPRREAEDNSDLRHADPVEALRSRITQKVERVKADAQKHAANGRNPSAFLKTLQETIKPLLDAGQPLEAEAELDRLLAELEDKESGTGTTVEYRAIQNPQPIMIRGYDGESLDPFLTRDGRYLLFNSSHFEPKKTALHYATRVDDSTFDYRGKIAGVNIEGVLTAVSSMDRQGNIYFVSPRSFEETGSTIHRGTFKDGVVTDITVIRGIRLDEPGQVNFDVEVSADGNTLYFVDSDIDGFTEAPSLSPDGQSLYFHKRDGDKFAVWRVSRTLEPKTSTTSRSGDNRPQQRAGLSAQEPQVSLETVATGFRLAEGPAWDGESLYFSDVIPSNIHKLGSDGKVNTIRSDTRKGAGLAFDSKRRLLICEVDGFRVTRVEKDGSKTILAEFYDGKKLNGPNDLVVDGKDGVYFTDPLFLNKDKREQNKEAVYYISPAGKLLRVADDLEKPNGLALTADGKTLFVADSAKSKVRTYPVNEDGTLGTGRDFGSVIVPDGVKVDSNGRVYVAGRSGIVVFDASGNRLGTLKVPEKPNSLVFGDADRRTMFITTNTSVFKVRLNQALQMLTADDTGAAKDSSTGRN